MKLVKKYEKFLDIFKRKKYKEIYFGYYFKKYLIIDYSSFIVGKIIVECEKIKDFSPFAIYCDMKRLYYVTDKLIEVKETDVDNKLELTIEKLRESIIFQSDDLEEVKEHAEMLISVKNYNL